MVYASKKANYSTLKLASFFEGVPQTSNIMRDWHVHTASSICEWRDSSSTLHCSDLVTLQN